jgi:signal transduction histidine kinase
MEFDAPHHGIYPDVFWLIRLRWLAIIGVVVTSTMAIYLGVIQSGIPLLMVAVAMAAFNLYLVLRFRDGAARQTADSNGNSFLPQILFDLAALTLLLHFAGGAENPFVLFYAFHMAIGAIFLPRRTVWFVGLVAGVLHGGMVIGEFFGLLRHYPLFFTAPPNLPPHLHRTPHDMHLMPEFTACYLSAFVLMLAGVIYLVQTVAEHQRTAEVLRQKHEQIALSRERLARIGEISAGIAHTIRNPLHGVINALEILRKKLFQYDTTTAELFDLTMDGLTRIERFTGRLLAPTRDFALRMVRTDIGLLVEEAMKFVESRARKENIQISVNHRPLPEISLDPDHIFEALVNLLDNALAACREGDSVKVTTALCTVPRNGLCIWVEDTGAGIPASDLARVVDPFFTTKPAGIGSGLGLAITNRIVEAHDGELSLESAVGKGTKVRIFVPYQPRAGLLEEAAP